MLQPAALGITSMALLGSPPDLFVTSQQSYGAGNSSLLISTDNGMTFTQSPVSHNTGIVFQLSSVGTGGPSAIRRNAGSYVGSLFGLIQENQNQVSGGAVFVVDFDKSGNPTVKKTVANVANDKFFQLEHRDRVAGPARSGTPRGNPR